MVRRIVGSLIEWDFVVSLIERAVRSLLENCRGLIEWRAVRSLLGEL